MMIEQLESIDRWIVLTINSWNSPFLDELMWIISAKATWIPLYLILIYLGFRSFTLKKFFIYFFCVIGAVALADLISVHLFKDVFLRYRPSHHTELTEQLHFYLDDNGNGYKGGMYGFVSSHASNFFALAFTAGMCLKKEYPKLLWVLIAIAVMICYSRIYLGVHYFTDVFVGALIGSTIGFLIYKFVFLKTTKSVLN